MGESTSPRELTAERESPSVARGGPERCSMEAPTQGTPFGFVYDFGLRPGLAEAVRASLRVLTSPSFETC